MSEYEHPCGHLNVSIDVHIDISHDILTEAVMSTKTSF